MTKLVKDAPTIWNALKGVLCIYKPAECKTERVREKLIYKLCKELNEMECRPPEEYVRIIGDPTKKLVVRVEENLADHPLVVGPRYQQNDIVLSWSNYLGYNTSGVLLFGLRSGTKYAKYIRENRPTRAYRIKGCLGNATDNGYKDGKIVEKSTWRFIHRYHMEKLLTTMQQAHQKKMFEMCGVDLQSELAYELATKGLVRPANSKIPIIYGIKCVEFDAPNFTLELQCINEDEKYLINLIHEIGIKLHSTAHCTGIQCIRHSYFTLDDALLEKFWDLQNLITNLQHCHDVINNNMHLLKQDSVNLRQ